MAEACGSCWLERGVTRDCLNAFSPPGHPPHQDNLSVPRYTTVARPRVVSEFSTVARVDLKVLQVDC
ncbi:hypothetical protein E2C01_024978 [Portunus trituberculatus]|uniref:Uncharacterized protein n=1 Tax=Portunus trituberculatus TaxID=210409 RepID=A0A5B7EC06_PORTR|nr:hypothetical protein [Portunus trituberculatus]